MGGALRKRGVVPRWQFHMPGLSHCEGGGVSAQRGLEDAAFDSHRLSGCGGSNRAPGTRVSKSMPETLASILTQGTALRLLPAKGVGPFVRASGGPRSADLRDSVWRLCSQQLVPSVLDLRLPFLVSGVASLNWMIATPSGTQRLITGLRTDRTMYVANAGGTPRVDPDQVIFGRVTTGFGVWVLGGGSGGARGFGISRSGLGVFRKCAPFPAQIGECIGGPMGFRTCWLTD